jgi:hypothetical protein
MPGAAWPVADAPSVVAIARTTATERRRRVFMVLLRVEGCEFGIPVDRARQRHEVLI